MKRHRAPCFLFMCYHSKVHRPRNAYRPLRHVPATFSSCACGPSQQRAFDQNLSGSRTVAGQPTAVCTRLEHLLEGSRGYLTAPEGINTAIVFIPSHGSCHGSSDAVSSCNRLPIFLPSGERERVIGVRVFFQFSPSPDQSPPS